MPRRPTYPPLNVFVNSRLTGRLSRQPSGAIEFQYDDDWLAWEYAFPVSLSLPLREGAYYGEQVLAVFDNLLPDNRDIRQSVAARTKADGPDAYSLLSTIGRDCVGAMQFLTDSENPGRAGAIQSRPISNESIGARLRNLQRSPLGIDLEADFRISIAGAQDKTALLRLGDEWRLPEGSTPTTHILKPQIGRAGDFDLSKSVENEHFCMVLLRELGFDTANTDIADFDGVRTLVVERFDRQWASDGRLLRRPQEDLCQALSVLPSRKYQSDGGLGVANVLQFLKGADDPDADHLRFLKAQIAFWLIGAIDGHAKNFSIFLHPGGGFDLTPLYDVMTVQHMIEAKRIRRNQAKMAMSVGDNRHYQLHEIQPRHFAQTVESASLSQDLVFQALSDLSEEMPGALERTSRSLANMIPISIMEGVEAGAERRLATASKWLQSK